MRSIFDQLYRARVQVVAIGFILVGLVFGVTSVVLREDTWQNIVAAIAAELSTTLLIAGLVTVFIDYRNRKTVDARNEAQLDESIGRIFTQPATAVAVAGSPMGEQMLINALTPVTANDPEIAQAIVAQLRARFGTNPQLWRDVAVSVDLAPWAGGPDSSSDAMFAATISCRYRFAPTQQLVRFLCSSNRVEYDHARQDHATASAWFIDPSSTISPTARDTFELVTVEANGTSLDIERTEGQYTQTYSAHLPKDALDQEIVLSYTYRVLVLRSGNFLELTISRPTKGFTATVNYGTTSIRSISTSEYVDCVFPVAVRKTPATVPARSVTVAVDDWIIPRAGVAFIWTLDDEPRAGTVTPGPVEAGGRAAGPGR